MMTYLRLKLVRGNFHTQDTFSQLAGLTSIHQYFSRAKMTDLRLKLVRENFVVHTRDTFNSLLDQPDFSDVTLVADDLKQIAAHKVILIAGSGFFRNLLRENLHPHPLIFLGRMGRKDLQAIVSFLYLGECTVEQDEIDNFLEIAKSLQISGLTSEMKQRQEKPNLLLNNPQESQNPNDSQSPNDSQKEDPPSGETQFILQREFEEDQSKTDSSESHIKAEVHDDPDWVPDEYICSICGKTLLTPQAMNNHMRAMHNSRKDSKDLHYPSDDEEIFLFDKKGTGRTLEKGKLGMFRGEQAYDRKNFAYKLRQCSTSGVVTYKCFTKTCPMQLTTKDGKIRYRRKEHNHQAVPAMIQVRKLEAEKMEEALRDPDNARARNLMSSISEGILTPEMAACASSFGSLQKKLDRRLHKLRELSLQEN